MKFDENELFEMALKIRSEMGIDDDENEKIGIGIWAHETAKQEYKSKAELLTEIQQLAREDMENRQYANEDEDKVFPEN